MRSEASRDNEYLEDGEIEDEEKHVQVDTMSDSSKSEKKEDAKFEEINRKRKSASLPVAQAKLWREWTSMTQLPKSSQRAMSRQICTFFRSGFCRNGNRCNFSHQIVDSHRTPELCEFYKRGSCKNGQNCKWMHGEWPCKAFHKGECTRSPCRFSHEPLSDFSRPLFAKMIEDEQRNFPPSIQWRPKKRALLEGPFRPQVAHSPELYIRPPSTFTHPPFTLPPPSTNARPQPPQFTHVATSYTSFFSRQLSPTNTQLCPPPVAHGSQEQPPAFDINALLARITGVPDQQ